MLGGRGRVLVFVDHVLVERFRIQLGGVGIHPGPDKRGQVQPGIAVQHHLVMHDLIGGLRQHQVVGEDELRVLSSFARPREERIDLEARSIGRQVNTASCRPR